MMARFDAIEARLDTLEARMSEAQDELEDSIRHSDTDHDCWTPEATGLLYELAEDAKRRERLTWRAEARAAMKAG